jgi:hypothetical protein
MLNSIVVILALLLVAILSFHKWNKNSSKNKLPGPPLIPYVGCVYDLPIKFSWLKFKEWADRYGPIYRTKIMGDNIIFISDETMAEQLLVNRARINSDRPTFVSVVDSKSTNGSMEYMPIMGRNSKLFADFSHQTDKLYSVLGKTTTMGP